MNITAHVLDIVAQIESEISSLPLADFKTLPATSGPRFGGKLFSGANCQALVTPEVVIKWYAQKVEYRVHQSSTSDNDVAVYDRACEKGYIRHFAKTARVGQFLIQEPIVRYCEWQNSAEGTSADPDRMLEIAVLLATIGFDMNIGDLHFQNWGFRPDDLTGECPVIFDWSDDRFDGYINIDIRFSTDYAQNDEYYTTFRLFRNAKRDAWLAAQS